MLPLAMIATWAAYAVGSWGYVLVKGYDISFRQWVTPLHPYSGPWPPPNTVPLGHVFPTSTAKATALAESGPQPKETVL